MIKKLFANDQTIQQLKQKQRSYIIYVLKLKRNVVDKVMEEVNQAMQQ